VDRREPKARQLDAFVDPEAVRVDTGSLRCKLP
jgi:hypothetical protein